MVPPLLVQSVCHFVFSDVGVRALTHGDRGSALSRSSSSRQRVNTYSSHWVSGWRASRVEAGGEASTLASPYSRRYRADIRGLLLSR